jgi:hypothetical protein
MRFVAFDTESHLIKPGLSVPRMVCLSYVERLADGKLVSAVVDRAMGVELLRTWLSSDDVHLIGHNVWFDLAVGAVAGDRELIRLIFGKLEKGGISDTMLRQQLLDVAEGALKFHWDEDTGELVRSAYHLADLSYRLNKRFVKKGSDTWRLRYGLLDGTPIPDWPAEALRYALDDAEITLEVFEAQDRVIRQSKWCKGGVLPNAVEQHKAAWALHLMSVWGVRTDGDAVAALKKTLERDYSELMTKLRPSGLFNIAAARVNRKGVHVPEKVTKSMKAIYAAVKTIFTTSGQETPITETGRVATDRKTLGLAAKLRTPSGGKVEDDPLHMLAEAGKLQKLLTTYIPQLEQGTRWPINPRYNPLLETGRTSCSKPNLQNPPRKGGVRECFIPRAGHVFVFCDYDTLELRALAQVCLDFLGESKMAEALRRGEDLHLLLAAEMLEIDAAEAMRRFHAGDPEVKEYRQQAKPANFGFPGGMAAQSFKEYAEGYGIILSDCQCEDIHDTWLRKWPEMRKYFDLIGRITDQSDQVVQARSGRVRGGASFCATANGFFQGLAADGAKEALWRVACECYLGHKYGTNEPSPLAGCRPNLFLHDEIGMEVPYTHPIGASLAADRLAEVMIEAMRKWIPDVPITAKPVMVRRWFKGAEPVRVGDLLVPSRPEKIDGKTKWVADLPEAMAA